MRAHIIVRMQDDALPVEIIGRRIRDARHAAGRTQAGLARAIGKSGSWLGAIERGFFDDPQDADLQALAGELGLDPQTFLLPRRSKK